MRTLNHRNSAGVIKEVLVLLMFALSFQLHAVVGKQIGLEHFANVHRSRHFRIYGECAQTNELFGSHLENLYRNFHSTFVKAGFHLNQSSNLIWILIDDVNEMRTYSECTDFKDMSGLTSYYSTRTNRVVLLLSDTVAVRSPAGTQYKKFHPDLLPNAPAILGQTTTESLNSNPEIIAHEIAHQLAFNTGLQKRGCEYPFWVSEGLATNFEVPRDGKEFLGDNSVRYEQLYEIYHNDSLIPLEDFVTLTDISFSGDLRIEHLYGQAWGFFHFIFLEQRSELADYLTSLSSRGQGRKKPQYFTDLFSMCFGSPARLEKRWFHFLEKNFGAEDKQADDD